MVLDLDLPFEDNLRRIEPSDHARIPVVHGGLRNVLGMVNARKLLSRVMRSTAPDLKPCLPKVGDTVIWDGWRFEIVDMDGKKIDKVLASRRGNLASVGL